MFVAYYNYDEILYTLMACSHQECKDNYNDNSTTRPTTITYS